MTTIEISSNENFKSEIIIEKALAQELEDYLGNKKYFLITNTTIAKLYPQVLSKFDKKNIIAIPDGEKYKNFKTCQKLLDELLKRKIERKDGIIALGGGVVGDIAGFVASSILRGVELVQIPTTLLAMVDSSIGGKTGFNSKYGKNLIGSFHLASKVLIDSRFLNTLNSYEYKCGLGEIVKYALIEKSCKYEKDFDLFNLFLNTSIYELEEKVDYIITCCAQLKANVVNLDKKESGLRKILNFGHTYAHAFETLSNYKKISHGEAVAQGMKCAFKLGYDLKKIDEEYFEKANILIDKFDIIQNKFNFKKSAIINAMKQDKKVQDSKINLLVPTAPAVVELFDNISEPSLEASLP